MLSILETSNEMIEIFNVLHDSRTLVDRWSLKSNAFFWSPSEEMIVMSESISSLFWRFWNRCTVVMHRLHQKHLLYVLIFKNELNFTMYLYSCAYIWEFSLYTKCQRCVGQMSCVLGRFSKIDPWVLFPSNTTETESL